MCVGMFKLKVNLKPYIFVRMLKLVVYLKPRERERAKVCVCV